MPVLELWFASGESSLSVRRFSVQEEISSYYTASVWARSPNDALDIDSIVGHPALFSIAAGVAYLQHDGRAWAGICRQMELEQVEPTGLSTYRLSIVPRLWLLTQRRNYRIFQHLSIPSIVDKILTEWHLERLWAIDKSKYKKLEIRIQYDENDYDFIKRLLEEAGISFYFEDPKENKESRMVLHDRPQGAEMRAGAPIPYVDNPSQAAEKEFVSHVRLMHEVRPGRVTLRDHDFRRNAEYRLLGSAAEAPEHELLLEQYHFRPGSFLVEPGQAGAAARGDTPIADIHGAARHEDKEGAEIAARRLEASRVSRRTVTFTTNVLDTSPGVVFRIDHPRDDLGMDKKLLVTSFELNGAPGEEWEMKGKAVFAAHAYRPMPHTKKPQIHSVQSAVVVGPKGEEIFTDEFGRVRVQFHWDREGEYNDRSSCWMRVSQGWAGAGFGMMAIPRIGQEVLVGFLEGDPDHPVVVGRLYNKTSPVPFKLPENKTVSGWKSDSSPGGEGFNELRFDDRKGKELIQIQAERTLKKLVKKFEREKTGISRVIRVGKKLKLTTGLASIIMEGPNISIEAIGQIQIKSSADNIILEGSPDVLFHPRPPRVSKELIAAAEGGGHAVFEFLVEKIAPGIRLKGSPEFRKQARGALLKLAATPTGRGIIKKLGRTGKRVEIRETARMMGKTEAKRVEAAYRDKRGRPGKGTSSKVYFNPMYKPGGIASEVVLGSQLIRAWHNGAGTRDRGEVEGVRRSDLRALGLSPYSIRGATENALRRSLQLELRNRF